VAAMALAASTTCGEAPLGRVMPTLTDIRSSQAAAPRHPSILSKPNRGQPISLGRSSPGPRASGRGFLGTLRPSAPGPRLSPIVKPAIRPKRGRPISPEGTTYSEFPNLRRQLRDGRRHTQNYTADGAGRVGSNFIGSSLSHRAGRT
jgi:hypothetical protein